MAILSEKFPLGAEVVYSENTKRVRGIVTNVPHVRCSVPNWEPYNQPADMPLVWGVWYQPNGSVDYGYMPEDRIRYKQNSD